MIFLLSAAFCTSFICCSEDQMEEACVHTCHTLWQLYFWWLKDALHDALLQISTMIDTRRVDIDFVLMWNMLHYWHGVWKPWPNFSNCNRHKLHSMQGHAVHWLVKYEGFNSRGTLIIAIIGTMAQEPIALSGVFCLMHYCPLYDFAHGYI